MNKIWDGIKNLRARFKRAEPLLMVKFPDPPGDHKVTFGFEMNRIHPFMSQAEVSRAATAILGVMREQDAKIYSNLALNDEEGSYWDHSLDNSSVSGDQGQQMLRAVREQYMAAQ